VLESLRRAIAAFFVLLSLASISYGAWTRAWGQPSSESPIVGVWNDDCASANMTVANPNCSAMGASLAPGTQVTVDIKVTNAPLFNAYEFSLFYDPTNLTLSSYNVGVAGSGPGTIFNNAFIDNPGGTLDNSTAGTIRAGVVNFASGSGNGIVSGSGVLAFLTFDIKGVGVSPFVLAAGTCCPAEGGGATSNDWTRLVLGATFYDTVTADGYFMNEVGKRGPVAVFTYLPQKPVLGQTVTFNATGSYDPDNSTTGAVSDFRWDFGDGWSFESHSPLVQHIFASLGGVPFWGNFSVRLTVIDSDDSFEGMVTGRVQIFPVPPPCPTGLSNVAVPQDCPTIQSAVNSVVNGGIVRVSAGTYHETVMVDKPLSLIGAGDKLTALVGGISILSAPQATVAGFEIINNMTEIGLDVAGSPKSNVSNNTIIGNRLFPSQILTGIQVSYSTGVYLSGNTVLNETQGIVITSSSNSTLRADIMTNNTYNFEVSGNYVQNIDTSNTVNGRPIFYTTGEATTGIPENSGFVGIVNSHDLAIGPVSLGNVGEGILIVNSTRITVRELESRTVYTAASILNSTSITMANSFSQECDLGLRLDRTVASSIINNTFACGDGLSIQDSSANLIEQNNISLGIPSGFVGGIFALDSPMNKYVQNRIVNYPGTSRTQQANLVLATSPNNLLSGNVIEGGLLISNSPGNVLRNNEISASLLDTSVTSAYYQCIFEKVPCFRLVDYIQDIDTSNTVEGKPIYYLVNRSNVNVPSNAGFVAAVNSTNISIKNVNIAYNYDDVLAVSSVNVTVEDSNLSFARDSVYALSTEDLVLRNNNVSISVGAGFNVASSSNGIISGNKVQTTLIGLNLYNATNFVIQGNYLAYYEFNGIRLIQSSSNQVNRNTVVFGISNPSSHEGAIGVSVSSGNLIVGNTIAHNIVGLTSDVNNTIYDNNFLDNFYQARGSGDRWDNGAGQGNYWSDYTGLDLNGDGVGDTLLPFHGFDNYPLMSPWIPGGISASLPERAAWPAYHRIVAARGSAVQTLYAQAINNGTSPEWVEAVFNITSSKGVNVQVVTQPVWLDPGAQTILSTSFPPLPGTYSVTVTLKLSSDAYLKWTAVATKVFRFSVD